MTNEQIKHMVDRFLNWKLPKTFNPDNGISYSRPNYHPNVDATPSGTNLFDAVQADAMVRHMLEGLPPVAETPSQPDREAVARGGRIEKAIVNAYFAIKSLPIDGLGWANTDDVEWPIRDQLADELDDATTDVKALLSLLSVQVDGEQVAASQPDGAIIALEKIKSGSFDGASTLAVSGAWQLFAERLQKIAADALLAETDADAPGDAKESDGGVEGHAGSTNGDSEVCTASEASPSHPATIAAGVRSAAGIKPGPSDTKSAPLDEASHNSGERDPSVMPDYSGAGTTLSAEGMREALETLANAVMADIKEAKRRLDADIPKDSPVHPVSAFLTGTAIHVGRARAALPVQGAIIYRDGGATDTDLNPINHEQSK